MKPLDEACLAEVFGGYQLVVTIEEHGISGGAGSAVAEWLARQPQGQARLLTLGTADRFLDEAGSQAHARRAFGLTPEAIAAPVEAAWRQECGDKQTVGET